MRVISGIYKRRMFKIPKTFKARPTTDFAKENLFNVLVNNYIDFDENTTALDLFAGTGSISIELVSRGCKQVVSVEKDSKHFNFIRQVMNEVKTDKCITVRADVFQFIRRAKQEFNFIFADPPYDLKNIETIPQLILESAILSPGGLFVFEHGKEENYSDHPLCLDQRAYGSVNFSIFRKPEL